MSRTCVFVDAAIPCGAPADFLVHWRRREDELACEYHASAAEAVFRVDVTELPAQLADVVPLRPTRAAEGTTDG